MPPAFLPGSSKGAHVTTTITMKARLLQGDHKPSSPWLQLLLRKELLMVPPHLVPTIIQGYIILLPEWPPESNI